MRRVVAVVELGGEAGIKVFNFLKVPLEMRFVER